MDSNGKPPDLPLLEAASPAHLIATDAKNFANRLNALKSTGPTSAEGKDIISLNALRHGVLSTASLLPGENKAAFHRLRESYLALYQPANEAEDFLVNRMILAAWRLSRLAALEPRIIRAHRRASRLNSEMLAQVHALAAHKAVEPVARVTDPVAGAYMRDAERGNSIAKFARYQTALERSYYRALHELTALRTQVHTQSQDTEKDALI